MALERSWTVFYSVFLVLFVSAMLTFLIFSKPSVTGYVSAVYSMKDLGAVVVKDRDFILNSNDSMPLRLDGVFLSGRIIGEGAVSIYLENVNITYLVYSNKEKKSPPLAITGFAVKDESKKGATNLEFYPELEQDILPDIEKNEDDGAYTKEFQSFLELLEGQAYEDKERNDKLIEFIRNSPNGIEFKNQCIETCMLSGLESESYNLKVYVEPGTVLLLEEIVYSVTTD